MSKSLQDQLLALGLAKEKAKNPVKPKPPQGKRAPNQVTGQASGKAHPAAGARTTAKPAKAPKSSEDISLEQAYRIRENLEKTEKLKQRERKLEEDRQRAALNREIRQIVEASRLNMPDALEARYFMYKERIRKVHVTAEQLVDLNEGRLGVVYLAGGYHLLALEQIEAVRKLSPAHVPDLLAGAADDEELWAAASAAQDESENESEDDSVNEAGDESNLDQLAEPISHSAAEPAKAEPDAPTV